MPPSLVRSDQTSTKSVGAFRRDWRRSVLLVTGAVLTAVIVSATSLLLALDTREPTVRLDVIKTALAIGGGIGALITLMYAMRRQLLAEQIAEDSKIDATEKRITELYSKGVDQLGSQNATVRLGGLYALERLAESSPLLRENVVDVLCAYLRSDQIENDGIMRLTIQRLLIDHLAFESRFAYHKTYWAISMIVVSGANLHRFHFDAGRVDTAHFNDCVFTNVASFLETLIRGANFRCAEFQGPVSFEGSRLTKAIFVGAHFQDEANFANVIFDQELDFSNATFALPPSFEGARIPANARSEAALPTGWRLSDTEKIMDSSCADGMAWRFIEKVN